MKFRVLIEQDEDGQFVATCPTLPGCVSQGESRAAARANIQDAIAGYLASLRKHDEAIPPPITEEVVEFENPG
jgi:predicted RNase H-like HicB family nuclease